MSKVLGKLTKLTFDGADVPIVSTNYDETYNVIDVTDNASTGDGKETVVSRATRVLQITRILKNGSGIKQIGAVSKLTFNSVEYPVTSINYEVSYDEIDTTDSSTSAGATEFEVGFAERKTSLDAWVKDTVAEPVLGTSQSATLLFATGISAVGNLRPESKKVAGEVKGAVKFTISGTWQGAVTETLLGLTMAVSKAVVLTYKEGATTDKAISGNAIITQKSITSDVNGDIKISETLKFTGAVTETVAN